MSDPQSPSSHGHRSPRSSSSTGRDWAALAPIDAVAAQRDRDRRSCAASASPLDLARSTEVYLPLSRLLNLYVGGAQRCTTSTSEFLGERVERTPFVIGVAGSVAVGKSTIARLLRELLARWEDTPRVELVTTDGFLFPNAELERRGLMERKGFPESYDRRALLRFVSEVKSGRRRGARAVLLAPRATTSCPTPQIIVRRPDVLIVEGLNVLQPPAPGHRLAVSDLFDFTIYVDARTSDIARWYEERFLKLQRGAFIEPAARTSTATRALTEDEARAAGARDLARRSTSRTCCRTSCPTRSRASLVLRKSADHTVSSVLLRKL